jgi:hypothetical protein
MSVPWRFNPLLCASIPLNLNYLPWEYPRDAVAEAARDYSALIECLSYSSASVMRFTE